MAGQLRVLDSRDRPEVERLLSVDPVASCFVASRLAGHGAEAWRMSGELWGFERGGRLASLVYSGANLVPIGTDDEARHAIAERCHRIGRRCSSMVGDASEVMPLWELLKPLWGPARDVRSHQPLMVIDREPAVAPDPLVRRVEPHEIDVLLPACIAMFTEEVGVSPVAGGAHGAYRARIADLIETGRALARIEHGRVVFKAEIGAATDRACQVQGVWVDPMSRGTGLAAPGMAAVVGIAQREIAPIVSLYVNDYNIPARRAYATAGFVDAGSFSTVLF